MGDRRDPVQLRPLSIGEIFDRAVTLVAQNALPFAIIAVIGVLPSRVFDFLGALTHSSAYKPLELLADLSATIAAMASAVVVAQLYSHRQPDWLEGILTGVRRLLRALGVSLMIGMIFGFPALGLILMVAPSGIFRFPNAGAGIVAAVVIAILALWLLAGFIASTYALCAVAITDRAAGDCVGDALALFRDRKELLRTMLFAAGAALIALGGCFVAGALQGALHALFHSYALSYSVEAIIMLFASAVSDVLVAVYYFDVRIRHEGYDVQAMIDAMEAAG